jgi:hypothetical protein
MSDRMTLIVLVVILFSLALATLEPFVPDHHGGVYMPEPDDGVLPFQ